MAINGRKGDKIISVYWFAVLFIVAAAIVYMVFAFYGKPYDIREAEAGMLASKTAGCLSREGYIRDDWNRLNDGNLEEKCNLNLQAENAYDWRQEGQYYLEIQISNFSPEQPISSINTGNGNLKEFCNQGRNSPVCIQKILYSIDKKGSQYKISILSSVRKTEKNAG